MGILSPIVNVSDPSAALNVQVGTSYTILQSDNGKNIIFTNAGAITVTLPDALSVGFQCVIIQAGAGVPTVTPNTDTVNDAAAGVAPTAQYKGLYLGKYVAGKFVALL
jgi:hypothetical protein